MKLRTILLLPVIMFCFSNFGAALLTVCWGASPAPRGLYRANPSRDDKVVDRQTSGGESQATCGTLLYPPPPSGLYSPPPSGDASVQPFSPCGEPSYPLPPFGDAPLYSPPPSGGVPAQPPYQYDEPSYPTLPPFGDAPLYSPPPSGVPVQPPYQYDEPSYPPLPPSQVRHGVFPYQAQYDASSYPPPFTAQCDASPHPPQPQYDELSYPTLPPSQVQHGASPQQAQYGGQLYFQQPPFRPQHNANVPNLGGQGPQRFPAVREGGAGRGQPELEASHAQGAIESAFEQICSVQEQIVSENKAFFRSSLGASDSIVEAYSVEGINDFLHFFRDFRDGKLNRERCTDLKKMATCLSCRVQLHLLLIGALYKDGRIHSDVENSIYKLEEAFNREVALTKGLFLPENINGIARTLLQMCVAYYGWQQTMGDDVLAHERFGFITKEMIVEKLRQLIPAGVKSREGWGCAVQ